MYNKLFTKIVDSSIWMEEDHVRLIWMMFIAIMDEDGFVNLATVKNVAQRAVMSVEKTENAIAILESPDKESSNPANEGRRLSRVPGGWMVLNSEEYRSIVKREHQKELNRERVRKHRKRNATVTECNADVMQANENVTPSEAEAEAEAETEAEKERGSTEKKASGRKRPTPPSLMEVRLYCQERENCVDPEQFHDHYEANGWKQANGNPIRNWQAAVRTWERNDYGKKRKEQVAIEEQIRKKPAPLTSDQMRFMLRGMAGINPREVNDWPDDKVKHVYLQRIYKSPLKEETRDEQKGKE